MMGLKDSTATVGAAFGGLLVGVLLGYFGSALRSVDAAGTAYVYGGYGVKCERWDLPGDNWNPYGGSWTQGHRCWHFDEGSFQSFGALDRDNALGPGGAGGDVYWVQTAFSQAALVAVQFQAVTGTTCTGVRVAITNSGVVGAFHYKHMVPASGVIGTTNQNYTNFGSSVQMDRSIGDVAGSQAGSCPWQAAHLHQSGDVAWYSDIWRAIPSGSNCDPVRCPWSGQMFQVVW